MSVFIDIHALQTLPPSNVNRDDTGAPKQASFGGVARHRVSSQAWKRAMRQSFYKEIPADKLGVRSRQIGDGIVRRIQELDPNIELGEAQDRVVRFFTAAGLKLKKSQDKNSLEEKIKILSEYLMFISRQQIEAVAQMIVNLDGENVDKKAAKQALDSEHSLDIALFGRMMADDAAFNVDAAAQVAHAIGVSATATDFDYFTAVDDLVQEAEETGAGMLGTIELTSSTLYRYATVNADQLMENLGNADVARRGIVQFVKSFVESLPSGKQNTFANHTLPYVVVVSVRRDRPMSWVTAFEEPLASEGSGLRKLAAARLAHEARSISEAFSAEAERTWVVALPDFAGFFDGLGESIAYKDLEPQLSSALSGLIVGEGE